MSFILALLQAHSAEVGVWVASAVGWLIAYLLKSYQATAANTAADAAKAQSTVDKQTTATFAHVQALLPADDPLSISSSNAVRMVANAQGPEVARNVAKASATAIANLQSAGLAPKDNGLTMEGMDAAAQFVAQYRAASDAAKAMGK
jgi:hypothetical protein